MQYNPFFEDSLIEFFKTFNEVTIRREHSAHTTITICLSIDSSALRSAISIWFGKPHALDISIMESIIQLEFNMHFFRHRL
jgi:hypothetical protein